MNKIFTILLAACAFYASPVPAFALSDPDDIIGEYYVVQNGEESRVRISKTPDGTYEAQVFWVKNDTDKNGKKRLDEKNPDKSQRAVPCDKIKIIWNLKYDSQKDIWSGGKVYDPTRGLRANATCSFSDESHLKLKGSLFGISETVIWVKEK